jgi:hypothetical protein
MKMEREREKAALINQLQSMKKMAREQGPRIVITPLKRFFNLSAGTLKQTFRALNMDPGGGGEEADANDDDLNITFLEWDHGLKRMGLCLESKFCRLIFTTAAKGDRYLDQQDFVEFFMHNTLQEVGRTLMTLQQNRERVRARCGRFIEILLHASEENRTMVAIMFQRKLVREFICECGKKLAHRDLDSPPNEYTDRTTAWDTIRRIRPFQVFEETIFTEIYNALMDFQPEPDEKEEGGRKAEEVACNDVCVALALLSQMNLDAKFATIFELFDNDNDGCLTKDQVGDLIYSVCRVAPIVRRDPLGALAQTVFDQSLEENDAMRFTQRAVLALGSLLPRDRESGCTIAAICKESGLVAKATAIEAKVGANYVAELRRLLG